MEGPRSAHPFVGRANELGQLEAALRAASTGRGQVVIVAGEAGIGKSRLVAELEARARKAGVRVLEGACLDVGAGALPYGPFVEILRDVVRSTEEARLPALLGPARSELARLLPELAHRSAELASSAGEFDASAQSRLFELTLGVIERLSAEAPLLLVVEDVQWADRASLDLLAFLARALDDARVAQVMTVRTDDLGSHAPTLAALAELEREDNVTRIDITPFSRDDLVQQVSGLTGSTPGPEVVDRVFERSDGNPFFVEELVAAGIHRDAELPPRLRDVLAARVAALPQMSVRVLRAAAIAGRRIDDGLLSMVLELPPSDLADALRPAVAAGLLSPGGSTGAQFRFRHALLQDFVAAELFPAERVAFHAAFATALAARQAAGDRTVSAAELARHWDAAGDAPHALQATIAAAQEAELVYAFSDALRLWERALELWSAIVPADRPPRTDEPQLRHRAAEAAVLSGEYRRAVDHGRTAASLVPPEDPARAVFLNERLRWYAWESGDRKAAAARVHETLAALAGAAPSAEGARALAHLAGIEMYARDYEGAARDARAAIETARATGARGEEALALGVLGWATAVLGDVEGGVETFRAGMAIAAELGSVEGLSLAATNLASLLDRVGRSEDSLRAAQEGYEAVNRLGVGRTYGGLLLGFAAKAELALGRWDDAERTTGDGLRRGATGRAALWLLINRARVLLGRGRFDEAAGALDRARAIDAEIGDTEFRNALLAATAELAVWRGEPAAARAVVVDGLGRVLPGELPDPSLAWLAALGLRAEADLAAIARARRDQAALDDALAHGRRIGTVVERGLSAAPGISRQTNRGIALAALIAAERERLEGRDAAASWHNVAEAWNGTGRPFHAAYARFREAEAHLVARERPAAETAARSGHELAVQLEATPLRTELERLAHLGRIDLGAEPRTPTATPTDPSDPAATFGFTSREAEVLQLVAGGWSNQQIADALFISRKTASVHVSNILGKLRVDSRVEAAAIAHRIGIAKEAPPPPDAT